MGDGHSQSMKSECSMSEEWMSSLKGLGAGRLPTLPKPPNTTVKQQKILQNMNESSCEGIGQKVNCESMVGGVRRPKSNWEIPVQGSTSHTWNVRRPRFYLERESTRRVT